MRKKQASSQAELPLEQRIRVADFLLLLITIDRRLTLQAKATQPSRKAMAGTEKAAKTAINKVCDIDPRTSRVILILIEQFFNFISSASFT